MLSAGTNTSGSVLCSKAQTRLMLPRGISKGFSKQRIACMAQSAPRLLPSISDLPKSYKGVLLDQFGVLHDGLSPYPAIHEAVRYLAETGARIVILSNSSRRSSGVIPKLEKMGFDKDWFVGAVTSGEVAHDMLRLRPDPGWQALGSTCLHLTWASRGAVSIGDLNLKVTTEPLEATFILAHGTEALGLGDNVEAIPLPLDDIKVLLAKCAEAEGGAPPMVVANPDFVTVDGTKLRTMPGTLARWYESMGGQVLLMGKPGPLIYQAAASLLDLAPDEVLVIGDSVEHDIRGANENGMDSVLICAGILAKDLALDVDSPPSALDMDKVAGLPKSRVQCLRTAWFDLYDDTSIVILQGLRRSSGPIGTLNCTTVCCNGGTVCS